MGIGSTATGMPLGGKAAGSTVYEILTLGQRLNILMQSWQHTNPVKRNRQGYEGKQTGESF